MGKGSRPAWTPPSSAWDCRYRGRRRKRERGRVLLRFQGRCARFRRFTYVLAAGAVAAALLRFCLTPGVSWLWWSGCGSNNDNAALRVTVPGEENGAPAVSVVAEGKAIEEAGRDGNDDSTVLLLQQSAAFLDRRLSGSASCDTHHLGQGGIGQALLLIVGILFTFNGLAIVCDEFFQASLEKISDVLELTPDVAGATFLAAGSSAPELFTSFADVFGPSNSIGVGTIVGSAMFNMLVIVAVSAAVATRSGNSLKIDRRVVARDVSFYTASIAILVLAFNDGEVRWWEGLIMVLGYSTYIVFMKFNSKLLAMCSAQKVLPTATDEERGSTLDLKVERRNSTGAIVTAEGSGNDSIRRRASNQESVASAPLVSVDRGADAGEMDGDGRESRSNSYARSRRVSRALRVSLRASQGGSARGTNGCGAEGDALSVTAAAGEAAAAAVDEAARRRRSASRACGGRGSDVKEGLVAFEGVGGARGSVDAVGQANALEAGVRLVGEDSGESPVGGVEDSDDRLEWPQAWWERFLFVFGVPFMVGLSLTVPDCSRPEYEKYYIATFIMSIVWISLITSYMVEFATGAACILGISPVVMGVLVLAVGTSVPDMIGSMIAAKNGEASMAIANAIGSNVFDILLGLGLPWLLRPMFLDGPTQVDKEGVLTALIILFITVSVFVTSLVCTRWHMDKKLGYCLFTAYVAYALYTILVEAVP